MSKRTGRTRYRVAGIWRCALVLQLEFERQRRTSGTRWPPQYEPERYWRDATLEDMTTEPDDSTGAPTQSSMSTWSETRMPDPSGPAGRERDVRVILTQIANGGEAKLNSAGAKYLLDRMDAARSAPPPARDC